jgi:hypothetical protein
MPTPPRRSNAGFAIFATVLVLLLGIVSVALTYYRPNPRSAGTTEREADVFAEVKAALVGYAARQGVFQCANPDDATACVAQLESSRLGEFPCPDTNNDGLADRDAAKSTCISRLGRVPWRTLGIPEPRDQAGETLWYAVSALWIESAAAINSATPGDIEVRAADNSVATASAVAVILSPGTIVGSQTRASCLLREQPAPTACVTASNFLENQGVLNKAGLPTYTAGIAGPTFNDRLTYILASDVVPALEARLGQELRALLLAYKFGSKCFCYPWADSWAYSGGIADFGINRGRLASNTAYLRPSPEDTIEPENWGTGKIPRFPVWLFDNDWHNQVYYIASRMETNPTLGGCLTCTAASYLTIQGATPSTAAAAAIITPGTPRNGYRPYLPSEAGTTSGKALMNNFSLFFDDAMNRKNGCPGDTTEHATDPSDFKITGVGANCDTLTVPTSKAPDRNRVFTLRPEADLDPEIVCPLAGPALYNATPCMDPHDPDKVNDVCTRLITTLQRCSTACRSAASQMGQVPCRNNRSAAECPPLHNQLRTCTAK